MFTYLLTFEIATLHIIRSLLIRSYLNAGTTTAASSRSILSERGADRRISPPLPGRILRTGSFSVYSGVLLRSGQPYTGDDLEDLLDSLRWLQPVEDWSRAVTYGPFYQPRVWLN